MKRSEPTLDDQIRSIHYKYEIPQDKAEALLSSGLRFLEIDKAALLSILAEVPIDTILDMRKDDPWGCIQKKLGLTAALYEERLLRHRARRLHRFYGIPEDRAIPPAARRLPEPLAPPRLPLRTAHRRLHGRHPCRA